MAAQFQEKEIPCDSIILDLYKIKHMGDLAFDRIVLPEPEKMIAGLQELGFHTIVIEESLTKESRLFAEGDSSANFAKTM